MTTGARTHGTVSPLATSARPPGPFVLFAGAGVSAGAPACLPGWWALNDAVLVALFRRIREVGALGDTKEEELLAELGKLRAQERYPPDYQADFLEEEAGLDYFRGLAQVDVEEPNPLHRFVATLVARGDVAAIVTTNFDRLFEIALSERDIPFVTAFDQESFARLSSSLSTSLRAAGSPVPILKVHGTAERPDSMIDTRRQRRRGRSAALLACLDALFARHAIVVAGFSGDDLASNPDYLGLRAARDRSPGLYWLAHPPRDEKQSALSAGAAGLLAHYGTTPITIDAAQAFAAWVGAEVPPSDPGARDLAKQSLAARLEAWATNLDLCLVTCMAAALCEAAGLRPVAHRLVRSAWNHGIDRAGSVPEDSRRRFLRAHARVRLRRGRYDDPELVQTVRGLRDLGDALVESLDLARRVMCRAPTDDLSTFEHVLANLELGESSRASDFVDAGLALAHAGTVTDLGMDCVPFLEECLRIAHDDGDDVREAMCAIEIALRLTRAGVDPERSAELAAFAGGVGDGIRDARITSSVALRHALAMFGSGQPQQGQSFVRTSYALARSDELRIHMARAALYWLRLAAREELPMEPAAHAVAELNDTDLGPLASWTILAATERAIRAGDPQADALLAAVDELAGSIRLRWYAEEAVRLQTLRQQRR